MKTSDNPTPEPVGPDQLPPLSPSWTSLLSTLPSSFTRGGLEVGAKVVQKTWSPDLYTEGGSLDTSEEGVATEAFRSEEFLTDVEGTEDLFQSRTSPLFSKNPCLPRTRVPLSPASVLDSWAGVVRPQEANEPRVGVPGPGTPSRPGWPPVVRVGPEGSGEGAAPVPPGLGPCRQPRLGGHTATVVALRRFLLYIHAPVCRNVPPPTGGPEGLRGGGVKALAYFRRLGVNSLNPSNTTPGPPRHESRTIYYSLSHLLGQSRFKERRVKVPLYHSRGRRKEDGDKRKTPSKCYRFGGYEGKGPLGTPYPVSRGGCRRTGGDPCVRGVLRDPHQTIERSVRWYCL